VCVCVCVLCSLRAVVYHPSLSASDTRVALHCNELALLLRVKMSTYSALNDCDTNDDNVLLSDSYVLVCTRLCVAVYESAHL
jgi:hypothetical protein